MKNFQNCQEQKEEQKNKLSAQSNVLCDQPKSLIHSNASFVIQRLTQIFEDAECSGNAKGKCLMLCCSKLCQENAIVCSEKACSCKKNHKKCHMAQFQSFLDKYNRKISHQKEIILKIQEFFTHLIDQLSNHQQQMIRSMQGIFLTNSQKDFIDKIYNQNYKNLKGSQLQPIFGELDQEKQIEEQDNKINEILQSLYALGKQTKQSFAGFQSNFNNWKENQSKSFKLDLMLKIKKIDTKIMQSEEEIETLKSFFDFKPIKGLKLLFRASENEFFIKEFYKKCSDIKNTLIMIKTEFGKVIGGFTPSVWKQYNQSSVQLTDDEKKSFIFSLTQKDKFCLEKAQHATYYLDSSPGPRFGKNGYADLWVCNKSNQANLSYVFGSMVYKNDKYQQTKESYLKFLGGETSYFRTKEWQVFEVLFDQKFKLLRSKSFDVLI